MMEPNNFMASEQFSGETKPKRVAILGASGSIGTGALEVIAASGGRLKATLLSVHRNTARLVEAARTFRPATVVVTDETADRSVLSRLPSGTELLFGQKSLDEAVRRPEIDMVLSAIVGGAGLTGSWNALDAGKTLALANKESLVMAGSLMTELAARRGVRILPVDSEHSAVWQCLAARLTDESAVDGRALGDSVRRLILTASGGPFLHWPAESLERATVADALAHPTWKMGKKITIDSATMMNKAFEIVEARWLFGVPAEKIEVMIHPQSTIHSMVEFIDSAVMAQVGPPDMRLPIQLALYDMVRRNSPARAMDWTKPTAWELYPPDAERFPALALGKEMARLGGTAGAVVSAANETAVAAFLAGKLSFPKIVAACRAILEQHEYEERPTLDRLFELDRWARRETTRWISV